MIRNAIALSLFLAPAAAGAQTPPAQTVPMAAPATASSQLQPALTQLGQTLGQVRLERWKGSSAMKDEEESNLLSIRRDLDGTLPPLLAAADAAPGNLTALLPVSRNLSALYDVLLRVEERGKSAAPPEQVSALDRARADLDTARRSFDDAIQASAVSQEAHLKQMRTALAAPPQPPPPPAPAPPAATRKKSKAKAKPASSN